MTRTWLEVIGLVVLAQSAGSQENYARLHSDHSRHGALLVSRARPDSQLRAQLVASDGRILVTRLDVTSGVAWLATAALAQRDSSVFRVLIIDDQLVMQDWLNRCLAATPGESRIPLSFGDCQRKPPVVEPIDAREQPIEQRRFRLRSSIGYVGPTAMSSLLFPRSDRGISFRLKPAVAGNARLP